MLSMSSLHQNLFSLNVLAQNVSTACDQCNCFWCMFCVIKQAMTVDVVWCNYAGYKRWSVS